MKGVAVFLVLLIFAAPTAPADQIFLPASSLERSGLATAIYRLEKPTTGSGRLTIEWTDAFGRIVQQWNLPFRLTRSSDVTFSLDMRRAMAMRNTLRTHLVFDEVNSTSRKGHRDVQLEAPFTARPPPAPWWDYEILMWQSRSPLQYAALRGLGVTGGEAHLATRSEPSTLSESEIDPLLGNDLRWYVENIATDFYSAYHRWSPNRPVNWRFQEAKKLYQENPLDLAAFQRDPSLSDANWLGVVRQRLSATVRAYAPYRPLFYDLGDETGIGDLSIAWDFDFSVASLKGIREWLKQGYGTLAALNRQWDTHFADWRSVMPMTTREAVRRTDDNFSAWADFKEWMDVAFARALHMGTHAVHAADREAYAGIEGGQIPGWGGYDYSKLAYAVDVMELYDGGGNWEIVRSLNPNAVLLTTSTGSSPQEKHTIWRELLRGSRGLILWDPKSEFVRDDGTLGERGREAAPYFREIRDGLGALLINSQQRYDPVAILYSPSSIRTQWMLDWKPKGDAWAERDIAASYEDKSAVRSSMVDFADLLERAGLHPRILSPELIENGALERGAYRILILPHAISLGRTEARAIRRFVAEGGLVIADIEPGVFDKHSRRLDRPLLADLFRGKSDSRQRTFAFGKGSAIYLPDSPEACSGGPAAASCSDAVVEIARTARRYGVSPTIALTTPADEPVMDVESHLFRTGAATIIAMQRDLETSSVAFGNVTNQSRKLGNRSIMMRLPRPAFLYDLRRHIALGRKSELELELDPLEPAIISASPSPMPAPTIVGSKAIRPGGTAKFQIGFSGVPVTARAVLHVDVIDPAGHVVPHYSANQRIREGTGVFHLPLGVNDTPGSWTIRATDMLSGQTAAAKLAVSMPTRMLQQRSRWRGGGWAAMTSLR